MISLYLNREQVILWDTNELAWDVQFFCQCELSFRFSVKWFYLLFIMMITYYGKHDLPVIDCWNVSTDMCLYRGGGAYIASHSIETSYLLYIVPQHYLIVSKFGGVFQNHVLSLGWSVSCGKSQTTQGISACAPLFDYRQNLVLDTRSEGYTSCAHTYIVATVNHTFWGTLYYTQKYKTKINLDKIHMNTPD